MNSNPESISVCVTLLQKEIAALESYRTTLALTGHHSDAPLLDSIGRDHRDAAALLRTRLRRLGQDPILLLRDSEQAVCKVLDATSSFGDVTAIGALIAGEKNLLSEYEAVLNRPEVDPQVKAEIRAFRLPRLSHHIETLNRLQPAFMGDLAVA